MKHEEAGQLQLQDLKASVKEGKEDQGAQNVVSIQSSAPWMDNGHGFVTVCLFSMPCDIHHKNVDIFYISNFLATPKHPVTPYSIRHAH